MPLPGYKASTSVMRRGGTDHYTTANILNNNYQEENKQGTLPDRCTTMVIMESSQRFSIMNIKLRMNYISFNNNILINKLEIGNYKYKFIIY